MLSPAITSYTADEIIPAGARVKFKAGSAMRIQLAGVADVEIGTAILYSGKETYAIDSSVGVKLMNDSGTRTCIALTNVAAGALAYRAASGKTDDAASGDPFGWFCAAALAGEFVEVLCVPGMENAVGGLGEQLVATATFDTAGLDANGVSNKTVAAHPLNVAIPALAVVIGGFMQVNTLFTSTNSTSTIAISVEAANDIVSATAVSGAPYSTTGQKAIIPKSNTPESTGVRATVARTVTATVAVEALLTGKATIFLYYVQGL